MKKYIIFGLLLSFTLSASFALAEETNSVGGEGIRNQIQVEREAFRTDLQNRRDAFKKEIEQKKNEWKTASLEKRKDFWSKVQRMIGERFEAAIRNLDRLQARVGQLIDRLAVAGKDTSTATASLNLSKDNLKDAKAKIAEVKALIPADGEKLTPEIFAQVKLKAREAKDLLKEAHSNLIDALTIAKDLQSEDDSNESQP